MKSVQKNYEELDEEALEFERQRIAAALRAKKRAQRQAQKRAGSTPAPVIEIRTPWVTMEELATHYGVAPRTVARWRKAEGFPFKKVGRLVRVQIQAVDEWLEKQK